VLSLSEIQALLERAAGRRVLCVGDLMVDRYVYGEVDRISPEAPIPVMTRRSETAMLGAAGNVARNVAAFGARVDLVGLVGDDAEADALAGLIGAPRGRPHRRRAWTTHHGEDPLRRRRSAAPPP
jgi:D-beta-D-heptose 7-phosphate kinase/D-beta-D-heptose 1-phosphate adenosyltransferase